MSTAGDFGNPLRKFKLVFLGEQSGKFCLFIVNIWNISDVSLHNISRVLNFTGVICVSRYFLLFFLNSYPFKSRLSHSDLLFFSWSQPISLEIRTISQSQRRKSFVLANRSVAGGSCQSTHRKWSLLVSSLGFLCLTTNQTFIHLLISVF